MKSSLLTEHKNKLTTDNQWEFLRLVAPPQVVIHIGAGSGKGELHQWRQWQVPCAVLIEADEARLDWANSSLAENPQWQTACAVLSDVNAEADFFIASNPAEDGLIAAEQLRVLWPNLSTREQQKRQVQRLDSLLQAEPYQALQQAQTVWTIIDCLTSLAILKGAGHEIEKWSVLCVRVLLKPLPEENTVGTLKDVEAYLLPYGYRCIEITESNNPAVGSALFVRDWQAVLQPKNEQLSQNNSQLVTDKSLLQLQLVERQAQIDALTQEREQCAQQTAARQTQLEELTQAKAAVEQEKNSLVQSRDVLSNEVTILSHARDQQSQQANEHQAHINALTQEREQLGQQAAERQTQLEDLIQVKAAVEQEKTSLIQSLDALSNELTATQQGRDQQSQLANDRQAHINTLTQERDQFAQQATERQTQLDALTQAKAAVEQEKTSLIQSRDALSNELAATQQARDQQAQLAVERQAAIGALTQERDQFAQQATERQTQLETLTQAKAAVEEEKASLIQSRDALSNELVATHLARDEQAHLAAERQVQIETLSHELTNNAQQAQQQQTQLEGFIQTNAVLNQEKLGLAEQHDQLKNELVFLKQTLDQQALSIIESITERDQLQAQLEQQEAVMVKLKDQYAESDIRQRLLNDEVFKAEAQLELIKDVLLREPGL
jgi:hypothetical protein